MSRNLKQIGVWSPLHACSVKRTEAERYLESQPAREKLRADVLQHLREKGIEVDLPSSKP